MLIKLVRDIKKIWVRVSRWRSWQFTCRSTQKDGYTYVYAIACFFLGKKSHIDILAYVNGEGDKIHGQHVRMKGFPTLC